MDAQEIKQLKELQDAYLSVYEAKKVDQDEDGDNDFADVRIARLIASGVSKEDAIRRVRDKEYNEEFEIDEATATPPSKFNVRKGLDAKSRRLRRSSDFYAYGKDPDPEERKISTSKGEGGITKNSKKLRKQKAMGEIDEATRMRKELGQEGETETRQELARRSNAYQRSGSVDRTIAAAERGAKNPYVARGKNETEAEHNQRKQKQSQTLTKLASNRRKSVRSGEGLRGYAAKVSGDDKDLQSARSSARSAGTLTPAEKKQLGEQYNLVLSYLLDEGYANTQESAEIIIANMSESWIESIVESLI